MKFSRATERACRTNMPTSAGSASDEMIRRLGCEVLGNQASLESPEPTAMWNFELLLENWRRSADALPFQRDIYFDTVGDLDEGNVPVHAVVFAIEGHSAVDAP